MEKNNRMEKLIRITQICCHGGMTPQTPAFTEVSYHTVSRTRVSHTAWSKYTSITNFFGGSASGLASSLLAKLCCRWSSCMRFLLAFVRTCSYIHVRAAVNQLQQATGVLRSCCPAAEHTLKPTSEGFPMSSNCSVPAPFVPSFPTRG